MSAEKCLLKIKNILLVISEKYNIHDFTFNLILCVSHDNIVEFLKNGNDNLIIEKLLLYKNILELEEKKELYNVFKEFCILSNLKTYLKLNSFI